MQAAWRSPAVLAALREHASRVKELAEDRARMEAEVLERQKKLDVQREKVKEYEKRTGKRRRVDERDAGSGKAGVEVLVRPTVEALGAARRTRRKPSGSGSQEPGASWRLLAA